MEGYAELPSGTDQSCFAPDSFAIALPLRISAAISLVISEAHEGLKAAVGKALKAPWQVRLSDSCATTASPVPAFAPPLSGNESDIGLRRTCIHIAPAVEMVVDLRSASEHSAIKKYGKGCGLQRLFGK